MFDRDDPCALDMSTPMPITMSVREAQSFPLRLICVFVRFRMPTLRVMPQMRDLRSVGSKLKIVLDPRGDQEGVLTKLKDCEQSCTIHHRPSLCLMRDRRRQRAVMHSTPRKKR